MVVAPVEEYCRPKEEVEEAVVALIYLEEGVEEVQVFFDPAYLLIYYFIIS